MISVYTLKLHIKCVSNHTIFSIFIAEFYQGSDFRKKEIVGGANLYKDLSPNEM